VDVDEASEESDNSEGEIEEGEQHPTNIVNTGLHSQRVVTLLMGVTAGGRTHTHHNVDTRKLLT
jgi:hypothetical protein